MRLNLKKYRKQMKYTQSDVACLLGIHQVVYGNYELGKRQPKPAMLKQIADVFNCKVDDLFECEDEKRE